MGNFSQQNTYICGLIKKEAVKQRRRRDGSRGNKACTNKYFLKTDNESVHVCKQYFLKTFNISDGRMTRALKKEQEGRIGEDLRGKAPSVNKTSDSKVEEVKNHILRFPSYSSHYTRQHNPNRRYLESSLNVRKMYNIYVDECNSKNTNPVSETVYRNIFSEQNLYFHAPSKDTCQRCDKFQLQIQCAEEPQKLAIKNEHELHLRKADSARQAMNDDTKLAAQNNSYGVISFDLQKALPFPTLKTSVAYYKRNLYCYNLGVHNLVNEKAVMHIWDETVASRGSQEIASCLSDYLKHEMTEKTHIIAYSDTCTGQNRNIKLALTWMKIVAESDNNISVIDHKFLVSGHSYMRNDADFGNIESAAKNKVHYVPSDWCETVRTARRKNKFCVRVMQQHQFKSTVQLERAVIRKKKNEDGAPVNWLKIMWMRFTKDSPHTIFYKESLNELTDFYKLILPAATKVQQPFSLIKQRKLYNASRPVTVQKKRDMLDLLPYIPPVHHDFFNNLKTANDLEDIGPLEIVEDDSEVGNDL